MTPEERDPLVIDTPTIVLPALVGDITAVPFGQWLLLEKIGAGQADVWRARGDGYPEVALKILTHATLVTADPTTGKRFTREYDILKRLSHPNIVQVFAFGQEEGNLWFAMRLVHGHSLMHLIHEHAAQGKCLPRWQACSIVMQCAHALHHAHQQQVVHRDVKPHNILMDGKTAVLADFGISRLIDQEHLTRTGRIFGTVAYMSPEQCAGEPLGPASDIYSLGCVLYQCLTTDPPGRTLFTGDHEQAVMLQHVTRQPRFLRNPQVNDGLMSIIATALAKEPKRRFATAADFARALQPFT